MPIIRLTDEQANAVFAAAHPLQPHQRSPFLEACAQELARLPEIGDGAVFRVVTAVQKRFLDPPTFTGNNSSKWSRRAHSG